MWQEFKNWLNEPFKEDMNAAHWFYFLGLMIVLLAAWGMILRTVRQHVD